MISQIKLQNFRCYENTVVDFKDKRGSVRPLSFIFGDNISGKTSFLMAFGFLKHSAESLLIDQIKILRKHTEHPHDIKPFVLKEHIDRHYRKGSYSPMVLEFDFFADGITYRYKMVMIQGKLIEESLFRKNRNDYILCFHCLQNSITWGTRILLTKEKKSIEALLDKYHRDYSVISTLVFLHSKYSPEVFNFHSSIVHFIKGLESLYIDIDRYYSHTQSTGFIHDHDLGPFGGYVDTARVQAMESSLPLMNNMLQLLFPNLAEMNYRIFKIREDYFRYKIEIYFSNKGGKYSVPNDDIPKSLFDFLVIMSNLIGNPITYTFIVDNFVNNVSSFGLKHLFETIFPLIDVNGIFTMADNDAMNLVNPADIQIAWQHNFAFYIEQLNTVSPVQQNHNLRSRFEKGLFSPALRTAQVDLGTNIASYSKKIKVKQ